MPPLFRCGHWNAARTTHFLPPHTNDGLELVYVQHGTVDWDYSGQRVTVPTGHLSFSWPWQVHAAHGGRMPLAEIYWFLLPLQGEFRHPPAPTQALHFDPRLPIMSEPGDALLDKLMQLEKPVLKMRGAFCNYFKRLIQHTYNSEGAFDLESSGWLQLCLAEIQRAVQSMDSGASQESQREQVRQFLQGKLTATCENDWTLQQMADHCGMGRTLLTEYVKQVSGDTPIRILARKRIERAQDQLRNTRESISEIAYACGFGSSQHFATVFKHYTGTTPSGYRSSMALPIKHRPA